MRRSLFKTVHSMTALDSSLVARILKQRTLQCQMKYHSLEHSTKIFSLQSKAETFFGINTEKIS